MVGFATLLSPLDQQECLLENLYVAPAYARNGIGTALVSACERLVEEQRKSALALHVYKDNVEALSLYKSRGFAPEFGAVAAHRMGKEVPQGHFRMHKCVLKPG